MAMIATPAPMSRVVTEEIVSVPDTVQVSPLQAPPREPGHTVEPFEVVIEIVVPAAWAAGTAPSKETAPRASSKTTAAVQTDAVTLRLLVMLLTHLLPYPEPLLHRPRNRESTPQGSMSRR